MLFIIKKIETYEWKCILNKGSLLMRLCCNKENKKITHNDTKTKYSDRPTESSEIFYYLFIFYSKHNCLHKFT